MIPFKSPIQIKDDAGTNQFSDKRSDDSTENAIGGDKRHEKHQSYDTAGDHDGVTVSNAAVCKKKRIGEVSRLKQHSERNELTIEYSIKIYGKKCSIKNRCRKNIKEDDETKRDE